MDVVVDVVICEFKTMELYIYVKKAMVQGKKYSLYTLKNLSQIVVSEFNHVFMKQINLKFINGNKTSSINKVSCFS